MDVPASAALAAVGLLLLCLGGNWLVGGGEMIAKRFRISSFVIGMTVVAYGTSTPELAASIAAAGDHGAIILGNIIGSNIANIGMVIGISAILLPLTVDRSVLRAEIPVMIAASGLLILLSADGHISQYDGVILLGGLGAVTFRTIRVIQRQRRRQAGPDIYDEAGRENAGNLNSAGGEKGAAGAPRPVPVSNSRFYARNLTMIVAGIGLLYGGAILTVDNAVILAKTFGLSEKVIGLTVIAIGTSLPELITSVLAIKKGEKDIGVGNIIGSNIYNVLMIMGVGAALGGVAVSPDAYLDYAIMIAFSASLLIALKIGLISRIVGVCMVAGYAAYIAVSLI